MHIEPHKEEQSRATPKTWMAEHPLFSGTKLNQIVI